MSKAVRALCKGSKSQIGSSTDSSVKGSEAEIFLDAKVLRLKETRLLRSHDLIISLFPGNSPEPPRGGEGQSLVSLHLPGAAPQPGLQPHLGSPASPHVHLSHSHPVLDPPAHSPAWGLSMCHLYRQARSANKQIHEEVSDTDESCKG